MTSERKKAGRKLTSKLKSFILSILERLEFKNLPYQSTMVTENAFEYSTVPTL